MQALLSGIIRAYQKILTQYHDSDIPLDILVPSISICDFEKLCLAATNHFANQEIVIDVPSEVFVVGDLHGNIHDLLRILIRVGDISNQKILFLGDYVDRGHFSIEVITLLFALVCVFPDNIFMIRGNHEFRKINEIYGFRQQVIQTFDSISPWEKVNDAFDFMPLAALIDGQIFCVHGGISPLLKSIDDIRNNYARPISSYEDGLLYDIMWSDPTTTTGNFLPSVRGAGNQFGIFALFGFLKNNNLKKVVRGHQCVFHGVERMFEGKLITVFSSSNYGEIPKNRGGFIFINSELRSKDYQLIPYESLLRREDAHFIQINTNPSDVKNLMRIHTLITATRTGSLKPCFNSGTYSKIRASQTKPPFCQPMLKLNSCALSPRPMIPQLKKLVP
ncbi:Serine/threonine-protein phosphatase PP1-2 [Tritrichomonas foetus]|uniref:Serine/threonine-protein phosphatase n=1 Tax=Tritrichomonas foetus TaxID=1144522 RepID=A0A1J4KVI8_9EUKA|nr:Serine/threonine-protein phosphatase PP1-2 [Tritrichomonas foetus]|eukprot:OHT15251.1 Serine/threonine-protein phosphatase PP1-2 [Tritrichomonas foetus]